MVVVYFSVAHLHDKWDTWRANCIRPAGDYSVQLSNMIGDCVEFAVPTLEMNLTAHDFTDKLGCRHRSQFIQDKCTSVTTSLCPDAGSVLLAVKWTKDWRRSNGTLTYVMPSCTAVYDALVTVKH